MKHAIPKSKAKNAYELLSEVKALILAEPKRYDQGRFLRRGEGAGFPRCGTIGCVAGWVATLAEGPDVHSADAASVATRVLGLDPHQSYLLYNGSALEDLPEAHAVVRSGTCKGWYVSDAAGTLAYAKLGAKHITNFQQKYAAQLKATRV